MLELEAMQQLREAYFPFSPITEAEVLEHLGYPSRAEIVETALAGMQSADRNERVLMLRVLAGQTGEQAMQGILMGLNDPERRVRSVAIKSSGNYLDFQAITQRLQAIVTDDHEKRKIRGQALHVLAGHSLAAKDDLTQAMAESLETLAESSRYRQQILFGLVRQDLTERVEQLLREFVEHGSKAEAIMATRALCGYRVIHIDQFSDDEAVQRHVMQTCEIAAGRMFYWITREKYDQITGRNSTSPT